MYKRIDLCERKEGSRETGSWVENNTNKNGKIKPRMAKSVLQAVGKKGLRGRVKSFA